MAIKPCAVQKGTRQWQMPVVANMLLQLNTTMFQCVARKISLLTNERQNCFPLIGWEKKGGGAGGGSGVATELLWKLREQHCTALAAAVRGQFEETLSFSISLYIGSREGMECSACCASSPTTISCQACALPLCGELCQSLHRWSSSGEWKLFEHICNVYIVGSFAISWPSRPTINDVRDLNFMILCRQGGKCSLWRATKRDGVSIYEWWMNIFSWT